MKLFYEADVLNGMQAKNADGEATPFSRLLGQSSAAEPGLIAFQATRNSKAVDGRIGFSPFLGLEFGVSSYAGKFTNAGDPKKSATIVMFDAAYQHGPFVLNGEYGRSNIVGKPLAALLIAADCTVTVIHSKTHDARDISRHADILIAAAGQPGMVNADWVKPGATIIDVGINPAADSEGRSRIVGDVDFASVSAVAGAITPVPGGVGPMTIACLVLNTLRAACRRRGLADPMF